MTVPSSFSFGTKAETLERLSPLLTVSRVLPLVYFSVADYRRDSAAVAELILPTLGASSLIVRSSARREDGAQQSMAGVFHSQLGVDGEDPAAVQRAVEAVIASYHGGDDDHVLVQPMLTDIQMAGVVMTRDLEHGSPYRVINYDDESGRTDSITGGTGVNKTVAFHAEADRAEVHSSRIRLVLEGVDELERLIPGMPLDIEFALDERGSLVILQVRPITLRPTWQAGVDDEVSCLLRATAADVQRHANPPPGVVGRKTLFGDMSDWNPAEMIGTTPAPLAASLYRRLITRKVWAEARQHMGYREVDAELMHLLAGHPYIDVRLSFNSFLPAATPDRVAERLVHAWLERLEAEPQLHDKVEFEVALTCTDFCTRGALHARYPGVLAPDEAEAWLADLAALTQANMRVDEAGSLARAEQRLASLAARQAKRPFPERGEPDLSGLAALLDETVGEGTYPFSILARHGFMAENLLRSAVQQGLLAPARLVALRRATPTVSSDLIHALQQLSHGADDLESFLRRFGHLRPGTYDITSPCYRSRPEVVQRGGQIPSHAGGVRPFVPSLQEARAIERALAEAGLQGVAAPGFFAYVQRAIQGREWGKFVFTRNVCDVLESIAHWGGAHGLSRDLLAFVPIERYADEAPDPDVIRAEAVVGEHAVATARATRMASLVCGPEDLYIVPTPRSAANFIGDGCVERPLVVLEQAVADGLDLEGSIVCICHADPGFDWIFTRSIAGLITQFGGANSHMAIRCAEFGLPAAIGCGEQVFERLRKASSVALNCRARTLTPLDYGAHAY